MAIRQVQSINQSIMKCILFHSMVSTFITNLFRILLLILFHRCSFSMAKHQRRWLSSDQLSRSYHDEMHQQSHHQKSKFVTKPNLRTAKNLSRNEFARKNRYF